MYNHLSIATSTILAKKHDITGAHSAEPFSLPHDSTIDGVA